MKLSYTVSLAIVDLHNRCADLQGRGGGGAGDPEPLKKYKK